MSRYPGLSGVLIAEFFIFTSVMAVALILEVISIALSIYLVCEFFWSSSNSLDGISLVCISLLLSVSFTPHLFKIFHFILFVH